MYAPDPIMLTIPGPPPRKNERHELSIRGGFRNSDRFRAWVSEALGAYGLMKPPRPKATTGRWMLRLRVYEDRMRHLADGTDVPFADDGSATECVKDALQRIGALDDDVRIVCTITTKHYDKDNPRVELELRPWDDEAPTKWPEVAT